MEQSQHPGLDYVEEFYEWDRDFLMVLEMPDDIKDQLGVTLIIDVEVDTREEQGWVDEVTVSLMPNFTLHTTKKTWSDAESHCQREGVHLASVTSEDVNQAVENMALGNPIWLREGEGRKNMGTGPGRQVNLGVQQLEEQSKSGRLCSLL